MHALRPYQEAAIAEARNAARTGAKGVLIQAPTGSGKTRIGLEMALSAVARGGTVDWYAHRDELIEQPLRKLREEGAPAGLLGDGQPITILSIQTAVARGLTSSANVVVFDEARHYVNAPQWSDVARDTVARGAFRIGLDATPTGDLRSLFDVLVPVSSVAELVDGGYLVPSTIFAPAEYRQELAEEPLAAYQRLGAGLPAVVFCTSVAHAVDTAAAFSAAGISAECVEGKMAKARRRACLERFCDGGLQVLTNVACLTEGADLPPAATVVLARGCSAEEMWIQIGGRALRPHPGKSLARIIDLRGHVHRFGAMEEARTWSLDGTPVKRSEALPAVVSCKSCLSWLRPFSICPVCGERAHAPKPPRITKAQLVEIKRRRQDAIPREGDEWEFFVDLVRRQRAKGKAHTAPFLFIKARGRPPRWRVDQVPEDDEKQGAA